MKTISINLYEYSELSEKAKQRAINQVRNRESNDNFFYDEAEKTVKEFEKIFPTNSKGNDSWLECNVDIEDNIETLSGERLRKYIYNNFGKSLYKPKYVGSLKTNDFVSHKRIKSPLEVNRAGNRFNPYYSAINVSDSCVLTGVCYDNDMLNPLYLFLDRKGYLNYSFSELLKLCYSSLKKSLANEEDYRNSDAGILDIINCNDFMFDEYGKIVEM